MATNKPQDGYQKQGVRIPKELHVRIHEAAAESGRSYNSELIARLEQSFGENPPTDLALVLASLESAMASALVQKMHAEYNASFLAGALRDCLEGRTLTGDLKASVEKAMNESLTAPGYRLDPQRIEQTLTAQQIADTRVRMLAAAAAVRVGALDGNTEDPGSAAIVKRVLRDAERLVPKTEANPVPAKRTRRKE